MSIYIANNLRTIFTFIIYRPFFQTNVFPWPHSTKTKLSWRVWVRRRAFGRTRNEVQLVSIIPGFSKPLPTVATVATISTRASFHFFWSIANRITCILYHGIYPVQSVSYTWSTVKDRNPYITIWRSNPCLASLTGRTRNNGNPAFTPDGASLVSRSSARLVHLVDYPWTTNYG